jgi:hypothetical protein
LLAKLGITPERGSGAITANTVRHWCEEVASDVSRRGTAALKYDSMFLPEENEKFQALSASDARRFCLASLRHYVEQIFPKKPREQKTS